MSLRALLAHQFGRPSGLGGLFMGRMLNTVNARVNALALDRLSLNPADHLLDVGFGGGLLLEQALARIPRGFAAGIEISDAMLRRARRMFREHIRSGRVDVRQASVSAIPFPDERFHKCVSVNTLHFWPDPAAGARELWRTLAPAGRLVLAVRPKAYLEQIAFTDHGFTAFDDAELGDLLTAAGFRDVHIERHDDADRGIVMVLASKSSPGSAASHSAHFE